MIDVVVVVPQCEEERLKTSLFFVLFFFENRFKLLLPRVILTAAASVCSPSGAFQPSAHFQAQCAALSVTRSLTRSLTHFYSATPFPHHLTAHTETHRGPRRSPFLSIFTSVLQEVQ